jgi:hypothetical protein
MIRLRLLLLLSITMCGFLAAAHAVPATLNIGNLTRNFGIFDTLLTQRVLPLASKLNLQC